MFDDFATVTAIIIFNRDFKFRLQQMFFIEAMANSDRIYGDFFVDAIGNIAIAPFLGTVILTRFLESIAMVVAVPKLP